MISHRSPILNPLASAQQLETSASTLDGVPIELQDHIRYTSCRLVQAAAILLRLPQEVSCQTIILLCRFWVGPDAASMLEHDVKDAAAAALYLAVKPSSHSIHPRPLLTVFDFLTNVSSGAWIKAAQTGVPSDWSFSQGSYQEARDRLYNVESRMLSVLGFQIAVVPPYAICINYIQALDILQSSDGSSVASRAVHHLNSALFSPQLLYLVHQPYAVAVAAIYLAARELEFKLPETDWWEVFDVDREDLGFLVVGLQSVEGFVVEQNRILGVGKAPLTVDIIRTQMAEPHA